MSSHNCYFSFYLKWFNEKSVGFICCTFINEVKRVFGCVDPILVYLTNCRWLMFLFTVIINVLQILEFGTLIINLLGQLIILSFDSV